MSYGKFGLKMPINNYNPRMSEEWNTGAAIGNLLGTLWGVNYQKRGEKKTYEAAQDILNNMGKQEPASDSLYQDYSNLNISAAEPQASTKATGADASKTTSQNVPSVGIGDIRAIEKANFTKNYIDKYKTDPNAVGNTIAGTNIAETVNRNLKNLNTAQAPSFKAADMRAAIEAELMRRNKPAGQIANAMKLIEPQILAKEEEYNKNKADELYQQYLASNGADMNALANLSKYNPALAKYAYDNAVYNRNRQDKLADIESARKWQIESEDRALKNRLAYANAVGNGSGNRGSRKASASGVLQGSLENMQNPYALTKAHDDWAANIIKAYNADPEKHNGITQKTLEQAINVREAYGNQIAGYYGTATVDRINNTLDDLIKQGYSYDEVINAVNTMPGLGDNERAAITGRLQSNQRLEESYKNPPRAKYIDLGSYDPPSDEGRNTSWWPFSGWSGGANPATDMFGETGDASGMFSVPQAQTAPAPASSEPPVDIYQRNGIVANMDEIGGLLGLLSMARNAAGEGPEARQYKAPTSSNGNKKPNERSGVMAMLDKEGGLIGYLATENKRTKPKAK